MKDRSPAQLIELIGQPITTCTEANDNAIAQKELAARLAECSNAELGSLFENASITLIKLHGRVRDEALKRCLRALGPNKIL